jgi:hypothetical protein
VRALPVVAASAVLGIARMTAVAAAIIRTRGIFIRRHPSLLRFSIVVFRDVELPVWAGVARRQQAQRHCLARSNQWQSFATRARMLHECGIGIV